MPDVDINLLNRLKESYDNYLGRSGKISDRTYFEKLLRKSVDELSNNAETKLTDKQINTLNKFIQHHNGKVKDSKSEEFYQSAFTKDDNGNLFLINKFESTAEKLQEHGTDRGKLFAAGKNIEELRRQAVEAVFNHSMTGMEMKGLKYASNASFKYDISIITRNNGAHNYVIIHEEGKTGPVIMNAQCTRYNIPDKDKALYQKLEAEAEKTRQIEQNRGGVYMHNPADRNR